MTGWKREYIDLIRGDHSLVLPRVDLLAIAARLEIPPHTLRARRQRCDDLKAAEKEVIAEHVGRLRAEAVLGGQRVQTPEEEDLPPHLERYLELYADPASETYDQRIPSLRALQAEGIPIEWSDILAAQEEHPAFRAALEAHWREGNVEVVDTLRADARKGKGGARAMYLRAEEPGKYGNKVKVEVDHRYQLKPEDEGVVAEIRGQLGRRPKPVQLFVEDVVEGEEVPS